MPDAAAEPWTDWLLDGGYLPSSVIRAGIRRQLAQRAASLVAPDRAAATDRAQAYVEELRRRPIAVHTADANRQHYEVGTGVLRAMLGPRMKYSCCLYPTGREGLADAELAMLRLYTDRAGLADGQRILDLGCGWGSGALFFAETMPGSRITALSNSRTQKEYIDQQARDKGLTNLTVVTGDVVDHEFEPDSFDRVVSIELFEHMKNYELLLAKVARWLAPGGKLFVHIFSHATAAYDFDADDGSWMATHFFTGGTMPSADLLLRFQRDLHVTQQWWVSGRHYARTCEDWLACMARNRAELRPELEATYGGPAEADVWFRRWQVFYMACAELFAYEGGDTWGVSHYLFEKKSE